MFLVGRFCCGGLPFLFSCPRLWRLLSFFPFVLFLIFLSFLLFFLFFLFLLFLFFLFFLNICFLCFFNPHRAWSAPYLIGTGVLSPHGFGMSMPDVPIQTIDGYAWLLCPAHLSFCFCLPLLTRIALETCVT
jgi:hypothetical protein